MKIQLTPSVIHDLEAVAAQVGGLEFSGFGFAEWKGDTLEMYDFVLLNVGSEVFTEIKSKLILPLLDRPDHKNMRVWLHRHPLGSDKPGPHNWSATDENTIQTSPLGGVPEMVGWSASIVRTPYGVWVGRIDNHRKKTVRHVEVFPQPHPEIITRAWELLQDYRAKQMSHLSSHRLLSTGAGYQVFGVENDEDDDPLGVYDDPEMEEWLESDEEEFLDDDLEDDEDYQPIHSRRQPFYRRWFGG